MGTYSHIEPTRSHNHRIPSQATEDGFSRKAVPLYGGTITTPDGKTIIVMEYAQLSWRLALPSNNFEALVKTEVGAAHYF